MSRSSPWVPSISVVLAAWAALAASVAAVGAAQPEPSQTRQEIGQLLQQLDSNQYAVRQTASQRLEELAASKDLALVLSAELQRALVQPDLSLEVRKRLEALSRRLPRVSPQSVEDVSVEEIDRLVGQLESDCYSERLGAAERLEWLLGSARLVTPIMLRLKQHLLLEGLSADARQWLEPIAEKARSAWLSSDPESWDLPAVSEEQMRRWIDEVARQEIQTDSPQRRAGALAQRELRDLLARDGEVSRIKAALSAKSSEAGIDRPAAERLKELLDLTRPALVAEFWVNREYKGSQYLIVGVPSWGQLAQRPSHFDRIDDRTAHCVSGQNLSPGDYPVGVAIPHPNARLEGTAFFHLVNLPTPRQRMAYEYVRQRDEGRRLAEISRRTVDRFLQRKAHLGEAELIMLHQLDPDVMSAFAAKMLMAIDDQPAPQQGAERLGGRPTHHGMLCAALAAKGTQAAIPILLEAIRAERVLPPIPQAPYRLDWIAALAISARHPWPEADSWLVGLLKRVDPLVQGRPTPPQLGATAAAVLLGRYAQNPFAFGLEATDDHMLESLGVRGCRFTSDGAADVVQRWWSQRNQKPPVEANRSP